MPPPFHEILAATRAVVFDFDSVLVDSEPFHFRAYDEVFARFGHRLDPEEYWIHWTSRGEGPKGEIERHGLVIDPALIRREKAPIYAAYCRSGAIPFIPEAVEMARLLHARGLPLAIASGSVVEDILVQLRREGIESLFPVILGKDSGLREKPHPEVFLEAARRLGAEPARCLIIEDAEKGVAAARAAGTPVVVVRTRYTARIEFPGADAVFPDHASLLRAIRESPRTPGHSSSSPDSPGTATAR